MAPKASQSARRARASHVRLDPSHERELFRQLPPQAQRDVVAVGEALSATFDGPDGMPIVMALATANRLRREEREIFDNALRQVAPPGPTRATRDGALIYEGNDPEALGRMLQPGDIIENAWGRRVEYLGHEPQPTEHIITVVRDGVTVYEGSDGDEARRLTRPGDHVSDNRGFSGISRGGPQPTEAKGKGFEPFSGVGRRFDDLNSLD